MGSFWKKIGYDCSHAPSRGIPSTDIQVTKLAFPQIHDKNLKQHLGEGIE
jgi:hypothetical protein